ncbi:cohesin domain-containing protein [Rheinheimera sp. 4Y26]|uniref:cohesin domain-containing protein n=1 Tax=Rheinheimera sp. 4Y26 TaxID=2977811 RepID=UPI0021B15704|nr:cohesin domain-containing protein [Rheinheimera sp. 4Y26]MCT6698492.1 cohesin domain-containing protein [Rheinheimera sp. 4Y26]
MMFKTLFAAAALFFAAQSQATVINIQLDKNQYEVGDTVKAELWLSDIQDLVTGFDASLLFNSNLLQLQNVSFGDFLSIPAVGSDRDFFADNGELTLWELFFGFSTEDLTDLAAVQPGSNFRLASISFTALKNGLAKLQLGSASVVYEASSPYIDMEVRSELAQAQIGDQTTAVSAPATAWLMLPALLLMLRLRRR